MVGSWGNAMLRDYQRRSIDQLYDWFRAGNDGNPCLVLPTGAGKSHIVAALCKEALQMWPETRILMLTHVKELIEQNAEKMRQHWPGAPMGIYSASIGKRQLGEPITFAGIQSVRDKAALLGHIDLIVIDECHLVSHKDEGGYRKLIAALQAINPSLRVIGLTATPYRLGHGLITDKPALFDDLIEPVLVEELIYKGHLSTLRSKLTATRLDVTGVHKRGGEYIESELQAAVDTDEQNARVVAEVMRFGADRKSWLFFCSGVQHAQHIADTLTAQGITAACVTGETPKAERARVLEAFKAGEIRALTNANVLTTGFDAPGIDLIAMLRPTMSPGLYVQMAGRGLRTAPGKTDCLVLDFAGVVSTHGPITAVKPPKRGSGDKEGIAPTKTCPQCEELVHAAALTCPACGHDFPPPAPKPLVLHDDDIMGLQGLEMKVTSWHWRVHTSRTSGKQMLAVTYYGALSDAPVTEYLAVMHDGYAGQRAMQQVVNIAGRSGAHLAGADELRKVAYLMDASEPPAAIEYRMDGKFHRILDRTWSTT
jgi:DNA repair protein RadD